MAIAGKNFTNNRTSVKKSPKLPINSPKSHTVGMNIPQLEGRKSRCSDVTTITNRSNHIPTLTKIAIMNETQSDVRSFLNQNNCGVTTLQVNIVQYAHQ